MPSIKIENNPRKPASANWAFGAGRPGAAVSRPSPGPTTKAKPATSSKVRSPSRPREVSRSVSARATLSPFPRHVLHLGRACAGEEALHLRLTGPADPGSGAWTALDASTGSKGCSATGATPR